MAQSQEIIHLPAEDRPLVADFEEVFRIGAVEGEPWENFSTLVKLEFDARGNLYLFDGVANHLMPAQLAMLDELRVLVFDGAGNFLREFGRMGEGPGEFSWPEGYAVWRDGTVVVSDVRHGAYQLFDTSGAFVRTVREPDGLTIWGMRGDPRGGAVLAERTGMSTRGWTSRPVLRLHLEGDEARADTVAEGWLPAPVAASAEASAVARGFGLGSITTPAVFEPELLFDVLPDGTVVLSDSSAYRLELFPPRAGGVERVITRPISPRPVTAAARDAYMERRAEEREARLRAAEQAGRGWTSLGSFAPRFHPELSVIRALSATWDGRVWVQLRGDEWNSDGPIDVLTSEGEYIGTFATGAVALPDAFGPDGLAAFVERDEFEVQTVVVRRLPPEIR